LGSSQPLAVLFPCFPGVGDLGVSDHPTM
jgi:hypothetical protein